MPIVEQSPVHHHHHGHGHQTFYHQQSIPEQTGKMQLTLILPNGVPSVITVDANTPMMDLLVQAASLNKLNPSGYSLVVLDSNQHVIHFKANQTVGQIGSSTISLLPKEPTHSNLTPKTKTQPFEITVRLQVNLPDAQKILIRVDPTLPLYEIKEQICKQKKYIHSHQYTLRLPNKLDKPLLLGLSLAEYKTNELTLIFNKDGQFDQQTNRSEHQSFDRLYRTQSETIQELTNEQQGMNIKQDQQVNTIRPSHTSLHAYWNDPNFDTQSQMSTTSSVTKKRRAPKPPGYMSPHRNEPQIVYIQQQQPPMNLHSPTRSLHIEHHQSQESLTAENIKKKRKAPVVPANHLTEKKDEIEEEQQQNLTNDATRPGLEPPPPPPLSTSSETNVLLPSIDNFHQALHKIEETDEVQKNNLTINSTDDQQLLNSLEIQTPTTNSTMNCSEQTVIENHSPELNHSLEQTITETPKLTPIIIQEQEDKPKEKISPINIQPVVEPVETDAIKTPTINTPIAKPPRQSGHKEKKSSTTDGLIRIINDHNERARTHSNNEKQEKETNENVSYFRVAKSRHGKFETDSRGFVNSSVAIFDSTNQQKTEQQTNKNSHSSEVSNSSTQQKFVPNFVQNQTKGKQAYTLLKKYDKEEDSLLINNNADDLKTRQDKEKSPSPPIQLEVTERTTHITVTVESDRKQLIMRTSPVPQQSVPPAVAPKPSGKKITEYRTFRRIGNGTSDEATSSSTTTTTTTTTATVRDGVTTSNDMKSKRLTSVESDDRSSTNSGASHEDLMESIRKFGGSQNLAKK
ncbi:unnamed protein product [Adineta steineri]|uniref:Cordon-bleu ubiquitin-like domain-containing protein n=1 Tax=Adineta steineri TaxID=433720 RepID=A0A818GDK1_9BILA|nr:unnamed protein product [Adineta steineri]